ncbi:MAG: hypothetical protein HOO99_03845, partial [Hyphomicrobiaceae bacterium]|nr:hypothetical protein [Hyphomicrobiaceae bacterium]
AEINKAAKMGALSDIERSEALARVEHGFHAQAAAIGKSTNATKTNTAAAVLSSTAISNLGFQLNDIVTMAAMGAEPMRILASQGGQVFQVLQQGEGGVRGSLTSLTQMVKAAVTPMRLLTVGALSFAAAGLYAGYSWREAQREVKMALIGIGGAAGVTARDINGIADASAKTGKLTVGTAREMAIAYTSTGKIGADMTKQLVEVTRQVANVYGEDPVAAAQRLASAFADPAKGVEDLNKRLAAFDATTVQNIINLASQNKRFEAQQVLLAGVKSATAAARSETGGWAGAWDKLTSASSRFWAGLGKVVGSDDSDKSLESQLSEAKKRLDVLQRNVEPNASYLSKTIADVDRLTAALEEERKASQKAAEATKSIELSDAIRKALPDVASLRAATSAYEDLNAKVKDRAAFLALPAIEQAATARAVALRAEEVQSIELKMAKQKSSLELAQQDQKFALEAINARTTAQRADLAYRETLAKEEQSGNVNAKFEAQAAKTRVMTEATVALSEAYRERRFAAAQANEAASMDIALIGRSAGAVAQAKTEFQLLAQAKEEAFRNRTSVTDAEVKAIKAEAAAAGELATSLARVNALNDLRFQQAQSGRSESEQAVFNRLKSAGLLDNGKSIDPAIEGMYRLDEAIKTARGNAQEFASTFVHDIAEGKNAMDALSGALKNFASKLIDVGLNNAFNAIFGQGGAGSSLIGAATGGGAGGGGLLGGAIIPGILHAGGIAGNDNIPTRAVSPSVFAGAHRFHTGGWPGLARDEVPAILQKGERVIRKEDAGKPTPWAYSSPGSNGASASAAPAAPQITVPLSLNITMQGGADNDTGNLERRLAEALPALVERGINKVFDRKQRFQRMEG